MFVACSLPAGFMHTNEDGTSFRLNGAHVGVDQENLPRNGILNNSQDRESGYGMTELTGNAEGAFMRWIEAQPGPLLDADGKDARFPFAPIASGAIQWNKSRAELVKAVSKEPGSIGGLTEKDMPAGLVKADNKG